MLPEWNGTHQPVQKKHVNDTYSEKIAIVTTNAQVATALHI